MRREPVQSSNVTSVGYDAQTQTLEVEFQQAGLYQYFDVPQPVYEVFLSAPSQGQFLSQQIRGVYRYARM